MRRNRRGKKLRTRHQEQPTSDEKHPATFVTRNASGETPQFFTAAIHWGTRMEAVWNVRLLTSSQAYDEEGSETKFRNVPIMV